jgi:agmatinase
MLNNLIIKNGHYEGCISTYEDAEVILFGAGFDGTSTYRPGSRFAPMALRSETLLAQEDYSPYFDLDLKDKKIHDLGDVEVVFGDTSETLARIEKISTFIVNDGKKLVCIGGEHLVTLPVIKPLLNKYPDLQIIQLDAHLDLMDELFGDRYSHGTVMRRIFDLMKQPFRIYQVGVRSGHQDEYTFAKSNTKLFPFNSDTFLKNLDALSDKPVYLTIDLDVFDPSLIPGTGTPEAGGIFFQEFISILKRIKNINIVGADMVELSPQIDPTNTSTIVASKILRELLLIV